MRRWLSLRIAAVIGHAGDRASALLAGFALDRFGRFRGRAAASPP